MEWILIFFNNNKKEFFCNHKKYDDIYCLFGELLFPEEINKITNYFIIKPENLININYMNCYEVINNKLKLNREKAIEIKNLELQDQKREKPNWDMYDVVEEIIKF